MKKINLGFDEHGWLVLWREKRLDKSDIKYVRADLHGASQLVVAPDIKQPCDFCKNVGLSGNEKKYECPLCGYVLRR